MTKTRNDDGNRREVREDDDDRRQDAAHTPSVVTRSPLLSLVLSSSSLVHSFRPVTRVVGRSLRVSLPPFLHFVPERK